MHEWLFACIENTEYPYTYDRRTLLLPNASLACIAELS